jgi:hypothetical protein
MKKLLVAFLFCLPLVSFTPSLSAHDGSWTYDVTDWSNVLLGHDDQSPWKGLATINVTNTMAQSWGDFHFEIYDFMTTNVIFTSSPFILMKDNLGNQYAGSSYVITTPKKLDFYFYGNPVLSGQSVTFQVYTDNTANNLAWFGLTVYPTPVPEPATMTLLCIGALALLRKK